ncbi:MAG TPA: M20/M25/M40 family metallo-hydrolase [Chloroflexota bacterium]|nr:M20/M25/M40 family metallo-hydrolase [Chloroflexota bacterium]
MSTDLGRDDVRRRVFAEIDRLAPTYVGFLQELLRRPSHLGHEKEAQRLMAARMRELRLAVDVFDCDPTALAASGAWAPTDWSYEDRPNVVGVWKGIGGGRSLILGGHIDTVPAGPRELWQHDPWGGEIDGNRLYGRGATDDKAGCAQILLVADAIRRAGVRLRGDLLLHSVIEDECTGNGTLACVLRGHTADGALVIDGTSAGRAIAGHSGGIWFRVDVPGRSAPAWEEGGDANAIARALYLIDALHAFVERRLAEQDPAQKKDMPYIFCIGSLRSSPGDRAVTADSCRVEGYLDFPPPETLPTIKRAIEDVLARAAAEDAWLHEHPPSVSYNGLHHDPVASTLTDEYKAILSRSHREVLGPDIAFQTLAAWCDLRHFSHFRPTPACLFGPGRGAEAHGADEYFDLGDFVPIARVVAGFVLDWCEWDRSDSLGQGASER